MMCVSLPAPSPYSNSNSPYLLPRQFALKSLLEALAPLIGAESELGHGVPPNYFALPADAGGNAKEEMKEKIERLSKLGMGMEGEVKELIERVVLNGWEDGFRKVSWAELLMQLKKARCVDEDFFSYRDWGLKKKRLAMQRN